MPRLLASKAEPRIQNTRIEVFPDLWKEFIAEFQRESQKERLESFAMRGDAERRLPKLCGRSRATVTAIKDGLYRQSIKAKLEGLEADRVDLAPKLGALPAQDPIPIHPGVADIYTRKVADLVRYLPLPEAVHDQMQREMEVLRFLFAETVAAGHGDRLSQVAALATEAAVFRGTDAIAASPADVLADPVASIRTFAASTRGTTSPIREGPQPTSSPTVTLIRPDGFRPRRKHQLGQLRPPNPG